MRLIFKLHSGFVKRFIKQGKLNNFWYKWRPIHFLPFILSETTHASDPGRFKFAIWRRSLSVYIAQEMGNDQKTSTATISLQESA